MERKTMLEILEETVEYYSSDTSRRANYKENCFYLIESIGNMCAAGRCQINPNPNFIGSVNMYSDFEESLKEEYKGHPLKFLNILQLLHDRSENWNKLKGISYKGKSAVKRFKKWITAQ